MIEDKAAEKRKKRALKQGRIVIAGAERPVPKSKGGNDGKVTIKPERKGKAK